MARYLELRNIFNYRSWETIEIERPNGIRDHPATIRIRRFGEDAPDLAFEVTRFEALKIAMALIDAYLE